MMMNKTRTAYGFRGFYGRMISRRDMELIRTIDRLRVEKGANYVCFGVDTKEVEHYKELLHAYADYLRAAGCNSAFGYCIVSEPQFRKKDREYRNECLQAAFQDGAHYMSEEMSKREDATEKPLRAPPRQA